MVIFNDTDLQVTSYKWRFYIYVHIYVYMHIATINEAINLKESKRGTWEGLWWGTERGNDVIIF